MDKEDIKENLRETRENILELKEEGKRRIQEQVQKAKDTVQDKREKVKDYARVNPEQAMLISAGAGFIAGLIIAMIANNKRR